MRGIRFFEIRVEVPCGDTATYKPADGGTLRLSGFWQAQETHPANWGTIPGTLTTAGEPLGAWLISAGPVAPDVLVKARSLGALTWHRAGESHSVIIAIPSTDPTMAALQSWADLPDDLQERLLAIFPGRENVQVQSTFDALQTIRAAQRMARLAEVGRDTGRATPLWQSTTILPTYGVGEGRAHTMAEMSLLRLPLRYQEYVAQVLTHEERILHFVPRPMMRESPGGLLGLLGRRTRHNQGILILTDQQLLWMVDALPPMETVKGYGYIAKSCVIEHITQVWIVEEGGLVRFEITLMTPSRRQETISIPFPSASAGLLRQIVTFLEPFYDGQPERSLLRLSWLPATEIPLADLVEKDDADTRALFSGWQKQLGRILEDGELVVSQAVVPAWVNGNPQLLTVTSSRVLLLGGETTGPQTYPLAHITSAELSHSVMQSWLCLWMADRARLLPVRVEFPLVVLGAFTRAYVAIRRGLTSPAVFRSGPSND